MPSITYGVGDSMSLKKIVQKAYQLLKYVLLSHRYHNHLRKRFRLKSKQEHEKT